MAKILVADDNSNIQKMVMLALKDQGIEVVAVGNGEAAVRKISDVKPDLVLADIFMPVRNGYEVCKFVKDNSALSHIPVILLVGAFDPLDEQEAQRVGADGVLKKPFVPPDPLIAMVKSALARAGVVLGANHQPTPPPPIPVAAASKPEAAPLPRAVAPPPFALDREEDLGIPPFISPRPSPLTMDKGAQPLAFGSLLDSPVQEEDAIFAVSPATHVAPDRDWGSPSATAEEVEEVEEASKHSSWRVSAIDETVDEVPAGQTDWREAAFSGIGAEKTPATEWAPSVEKNTLSITEEEAAALTRDQDVFPAVGDARGPEDWGKAIEEVFPDKLPVNAAPQTSPTQELPAVPPPPIPEPVRAILPELAQPDAAAAANSWMAGAVNPWESEIQHASQLASTWDSPKIASAAVVEESTGTESSRDSGITAGAQHPHTEEQLTAEPVLEESPEKEPPSELQLPAEPVTEAVSAIETLLSPVTQEILHEEAALAVAEQQPALQELTDAAVPVANGSASAPTPNMDEIVAKVLAKMNPEVLQAVTREILKPLVEAMIKDELQKK